MKRLIPILAVFAGVALRAAPIEIAAGQRTEPVDFTREILPLLKKNCLACHNTTKAKGDLNLETPEMMLKGGASGPALVVGDGAASLLLKSAAHQVEDLIMPPPGNKSNAVALTSEQLGLLKLWIDQGAKGGSNAELAPGPDWRAFPAGYAPVNAVAISPGGRFVAAARANRVEICEVGTGRVVGVLADPELAKSGPWKDQAVADRDAVMSVDFHGEDLIATGGFRTLRLWRRGEVDVRRELGTLPEAASVLAVSTDGKWMAAGDAKGAIHLWASDAEKFEPAQLKEGDSAITALRFSSDGLLVVAGSQDLSVRLWSVAERTVVYRTTVPARAGAFAFINGGKEIAAVCEDGVLRVWTWLQELPSEPQPPAREYKLQGGAIAAMEALSAEGTRIAWVAADQTLRVVDAANGKEVRKVALEHPRQHDVILAEAGLARAQQFANVRKARATVAAEAARKEAEAAKAAAQKVVPAEIEYRAKLAAADQAAAALRAAPGDKGVEGTAKKAEGEFSAADRAYRAAKTNAELGARLAGEAASALIAAENAAAISDAALTAAQARLDEAKKAVAEAAPTAASLVRLDDATFAVQAGDQRVRIYAAESGQLLETLDLAAAAMAGSAQGLVVARSDKRVAITTARRGWKLERVIGNPDDPDVLVDRVLAVDFSPDGRSVATAGGIPSRSGEVKWWRVADGVLVRALDKPHVDTVNAIRFSPDGERLATASSDRFARIWRADNGERLANLEGHTGHVFGIAWRSDGLALATAGADRSVRLWDAATRKATKTTGNYGGEVYGVDFVGAGDAVVSASGDRTVKLGDQPLPEQSAAAFCASADETGRFVAAGGEDGAVRIWRVADRKVVRTFAPPPAAKEVASAE